LSITDDPTVHVSGIAKGRRKDDKSLAAKSRAGGSGQLAKRYLIKNMCMCNKRDSFLQLIYGIIRLQVFLSLQIIIVAFEIHLQ
jgi:hypothetical protein